MQGVNAKMFSALFTHFLSVCHIRVPPQNARYVAPPCCPVTHGVRFTLVRSDFFVALHRRPRFDHQAQQQWATVVPELYVIRSPTVGSVPKSSRRPLFCTNALHWLVGTLKQSFSGAEQLRQAALQ